MVDTVATDWSDGCVLLTNTNGHCEGHVMEGHVREGHVMEGHFGLGHVHEGHLGR
jgi:hypothetical protein